jgi:hypothetical protein
MIMTARSATLATLIGYDQETPVVRSLQARGLRFSREMFALHTDNDLHLAAIRAGYGIGICQVPIGRRNAIHPPVTQAVWVRPRNLAGHAWQPAGEPANARSVRPP